MALNASDNLIDTLVRFGLTQNQARLYLANLRTGCASVQVIAKAAGIAREDAYRLLPSMQNLGLITKYIGKPLCYEAVEPNEVISLLLAGKAKQLTELKQDAQEFVTHCPKKSDPFADEDFYSMVTNLDISVQKIIDAFKTTKYSYDVTSGYERFISRVNMPEKESQTKEMLKAVNRGVTVRLILDQPKNKQKIPLSRVSTSSGRALISHPNFNYKYIDTDNVGLFGIFDSRLIFIEMQQGPRVLLPQLWSNNKVLLGLGKAFFESAWKFSYNPE